MRTAEREIRGAVDECVGRGRLNREAVGWSRQPLHRCRIAGRWPRVKRWDYWCVTSETAAFSVTVANFDYLGLVTAGFFEFAAGCWLEKTVAVPFAPGFRQPETVGGADIRISRRNMAVAILEEAGGTRLGAEYKAAGRTVRADIFVELPPGHDTLNVLVPWSDRRFQFTSKHTARPARGAVAVDSTTHAFGPENGAFGCLDFGRGVWPYRTVWNWAAAAGTAGDRVVGLTFGAKWTDGTGATENGLCVDGRLHKISEDVVFEYRRDDWMRPWRLRTEDSDRVDLTAVRRSTGSSSSSAIRAADNGARRRGSSSTTKSRTRW